MRGGSTTGSLAAMGNPPITVTLTPLDAEVFYASMPRGETVVGFTNFDREGRPAYVLSGGRATRRVAERKAPAKKSTTATRPPAKKSTKKRAGTRTRCGEKLVGSGRDDDHGQQWIVSRESLESVPAAFDEAKILLIATTNKSCRAGTFLLSMTK